MDYENEDQKYDLILARYLSASGKTEDELNAIDRFLLSIVYLIKGRRYIDRPYEETDEYTEMQVVNSMMPQIIMLGAALIIVLRFIYRIYMATR